MKRKAILAFSVVLAACSGTFACTTDGAEDGLDGDEDAGGGASDDDSSDDDAADDDSGDDDVADDDSGDDDVADDDVGDDDSGDDDVSDDDSGDDDVDGGADDDVEGDDDVDGGADDDVEGDDDVDGGADDDVEGDDDVDGGADDDVEVDGGGDPIGGGTTRSGFVTIGQSVLSIAGTEIVSGFGAAGFAVTETTEDGEVVLPDCETTTVDDCTLVSCVVSDGGGGGGGTSTSTNVSAGDVTVAGAGEEIVMTPNEEATYSTYSGMTALWEGGEALTASAPGTEDVPAFEVDITAPSAVTLTEPVIDILTPVSASRAEPFEVAWSEGEEGLVMVSLVDTTEGAEVTHQIQCALPASSGGTSISEELLADFGDSGAISVVIQASGVATVEDWNISFTASQSLATGQVEFTE